MYQLEYGANGFMGCMGWMFSCAAGENRVGYWFPCKPTKKQIRRAINGKL